MCECAIVVAFGSYMVWYRIRVWTADIEVQFDIEECYSIASAGTVKKTRTDASSLSLFVDAVY